MRLFPIILFLILIGTSCSSDGCLDNHSAIPLAEAYQSETGKATTMRGVEIHGIGAPNDSVLVDASTSFSEVYLPMRSSQSSTAWCLSYAYQGLNTADWNDTITFTYSSEPFFASEECGAMYNYRILRSETTNHVLDSVVIVDSLITNIDRVSIRLYFPDLSAFATDQ